MRLTNRLILDVGALTVDKEALGQRFAMPDSRGTTIVIPATDDDFNFSDEPSLRIHAFSRPKGSFGDVPIDLHSRHSFAFQSNPLDQSLAALAIDFRLRESRTFSVDEMKFPDRATANLFDNSVSQFIYDNMTLILDFVRHLRAATAQHWLDTEDHPIRLLWPVFFLDESGSRLPYTRSATYSLTTVDRSATGYKRAAAPEDIRFAARFAKTTPSMADLMLLDADHWARFGYKNNPGDERIILYSAIAVELSAKRAISNHASGKGAELAKKIAKSTSSSIASIELFHSVFSAAFERSYHAEFKDRFLCLQSLFEVRNQFVHGGKANLKYPIEQYVETAIHAVAWVHSITLDPPP